LRKKYIFISILFLLISIGLFVYFKATASTKQEGIDSFPESYKQYLRE